MPCGTFGSVPDLCPLDTASSTPAVVAISSISRCCHMSWGSDLPPLRTAVRSPDGSSLLSSLSAFRLALIQLQVSSIKSENLTRACGLIREASKQGAQIVSLPVSLWWPPLYEHCRPSTVVSAYSLWTPGWFLVHMEGDLARVFVIGRASLVTGL